MSNPGVQINAQNISGGVAVGAASQAVGEGGVISNGEVSTVLQTTSSPAPEGDAAKPRPKSLLESLRSVIEGIIGSLIAAFIGSHR